MEPLPTFLEDLLDAEELKNKFGLFNYSVLGLMLFISALIDVYYGWRGQKNIEEFLLGGRSMGTLPMTMSLFASFVSAGTLLGMPSDIYTVCHISIVYAFCHVCCDESLSPNLFRIESDHKL